MPEGIDHRSEQLERRQREPWSAQGGASECDPQAGQATCFLPEAREQDQIAIGAF